MLFNTFDFLLFFVVVYVLQRALPHRPRNVLLLLASYFFYGCWNWRFLSLIFVSTYVDYHCSWRIYRSDEARVRKRYLAASVICNLTLLGVFKYFNFFVDSAVSLMAALGLNPMPWHLDVVLPVGISFYTFQTMSYTIDVYRGLLAPLKNPVDFALYVAFFPQLVAGPIERGKDLAPQMTRKPKVTSEQLRLGAWLVMWGLFKKAVIADNMARIVDPVFGEGASPTGGAVMVATYAFAFQIYADFSGYSDIARGLAKLMGYELRLNFCLPYFAKNPREFWRRWHISLSTWLRDYLYIPLGGNRAGRLNTYRNVMIVMLLGGLWHGAAWTFVLWGAYHGVLLVVHRFAREAGYRYEPRTPSGRAAWSLLRMAVMFHLVCLGWIFFRARSFAHVQVLFDALFNNFVFTEAAARGLWQMLALVSPLVLVQVIQERTGDTAALLKLSTLARSAAYSVVVMMLLALGSFGGKEFIYFQF